VPAFARHFMTMPGTVDDRAAARTAGRPVRQLAAEFVGRRSLRDMAGNRELRPSSTNACRAAAPAAGGVRPGVVQVDTLALRHDKFDANRARIGTLWLAADERRVQHRARAPARGAVRRTGMAPHPREEQATRLRHRRAELRQDESLERAELSLKNAERAQAIRGARDRTVWPHRRIAHAQAGDRTRRRRCVAELEHELAQKRGARGRRGRMAHLRELAAIRMRTELEVAQQDAPQARTLAQQRFSHQLLQQQIRNKIEQAQGIEDASRQRAELARLHEAEQAAARARARSTTKNTRPPEPAAAGQRGAPARSRARARMGGACRPGARACCAPTRRRWKPKASAAGNRRAAPRGGQQDALAQHEKLLRTIEADALARAANERWLGAERATRQPAPSRASWQLELRRMERAETSCARTGAPWARWTMPPSWRWRRAERGPAGRLLKTRVHAGMDAGQLAALAGVVAPQRWTPARLAQEGWNAGTRAARARGRQGPAPPARPAGLAERRQQGGAGQPGPASAPAWPRCAPAPPACHGHASRPGDRFCAACGAACRTKG
jgi:hypothetical protein